MFKKFRKTVLLVLAACAMFAMTVFAVPEGQAAEGQPAGPAGMLSMFAPLILMVVIFYFLLIRPQRKKDKALKNMIANLKVGDVVASIGGIHGKIIRIKDDIFVLESGIGTTKSYISLDRSAISRLVKEGAGKAQDVAPIPDAEDPFEDTETETKTEE